MNLLGSIAQGAYWANQVQGDQLAQQSQSINNQLGLQQLAQGKMQIAQQQQEQQSAQTAQQSLQQLLQQKDQTPLKMAQGIDQIANSVSINDPKLADSLRKESKGYRDQAQAQVEQTNQQISEEIDGAKYGDAKSVETLANLLGRPVPKNKAELDTLTNTAESRVMGYKAHAELEEKAQEAKDKLQEKAQEDKWRHEDKRMQEETISLLRQGQQEDKKQKAQEMGNVHANSVIDSVQKSNDYKTVDNTIKDTELLRSFINSGGTAATPQIQQALSETYTKIRATNKTIGQNASFGDFEARLANNLNKGISGSYSEADKELIAKMLDATEKEVIKPAQEKIIRSTEDRVMSVGGDPKLVKETLFPYGIPEKEKVDTGLPSYENYGTLKSGAQYTDPDGNIRVKR